MMTKVFKGANVFMSRNLVPPEVFDALHDALKLNGAQVLLCCDPSRNGPNDYHVISSSDHEKFKDLRSKGCKLLGPQCLLSCAKEHRLLPNQGFTCCLAMDGVNILVSGFEKDEKVEIEKLVTAMCGVLQTRASSDVSFVIVKNVLAQKYKWALNNLKKPILTINWLHRCWKEHRVVPHESYRVLPFSGLTICVSGIPADERRQLEKLVVQNGGKYSAELTKRCTHLICHTPEGDKYKVAKRWGHIHIVALKWFDQSVSRRACLNEESYPVLASSTSSLSTLKTMDQHSQDKGFRSSQHASSYMTTVSDSEANLSAQPIENDHENVTQNMCATFSDATAFTTKESGSLAEQHVNDAGYDRCVADDSESGDDDLYLSECKILLVGFEASEMCKLVDMVRRGGGSRYMSFSERLTHIVVGNPSESEIKEVRSLAAVGVIHIVKTSWLQDCCSERKEIPVLQRHIPSNLLLPNDPVIFNRGTASSIDVIKSGKTSSPETLFTDGTIQENVPSGSEVSLKAKMKGKNGSSDKGHDKMSIVVFEGKLFRFSSSFPEAQRPEIVQWINQGGGEMVADQNEKNAHYTVERHGVVPCQTHIMRSTYVSSHWIHSCLEAGCLLDVAGHILYSPLPCQIPLPGFEGYRLCVSQYDMKERQLLRNLCFVLGVKFVEKLTKKVSHLLCKFTGGDKYEVACKWGIQLVTAEWIFECVIQNKVVDPNPFYPKEPSSQDREAGLCNVSQYHTQSFRLISGKDASLCPSQSQDIRNKQTVTSTGLTARNEAMDSSSSKRARHCANDGVKHLDALTNDNSAHMKNATENKVLESCKEFSLAVPDVAAAIEDLLEQTSKIQDHKSAEASGCNKNTFPSDSTRHDQGPAEGRSDLEPKHWINRFDEKYDNSVGDVTAKEVYDGFSETQTESQVVGYEEDLSGRQMIIDRVRTRSSMA